MTRPQEYNLYKILIDKGFSFVGNGRFGTKDIYKAVKAEFEEFCDDDYPCNCGKGFNQPEWQHTVRRALMTLIFKRAPIKPSGIRGYYDFDY